jgi:hypothetical protein
LLQQGKDREKMGQTLQDKIEENLSSWKLPPEYFAEVKQIDWIASYLEHAEHHPSQANALYNVVQSCLILLHYFIC